MRFEVAKLYQNSRGGYYTKSKNLSGQVVTLQIDDEGVQWLLRSGYREGDEIDAARPTLRENNWLYTLGEFQGGGELDLQATWVPNQALNPGISDSAISLDEPLTVPCDDEFSVFPKFLLSPINSVYYTVLHVENSSDLWLQVPVLIKHYGAMELIRLGAQVGDEFTESGLRLIFLRRWGYFDEERYQG